MAKGMSIHFGLNHLDPTHYAGWEGRLNACENDARCMQQIAEKAGYQTNLRLSDQATRAAMIELLTKAATDLRGGDILLVTYSGHGNQVPDLDGDEADGLDETWCLYDGQIVDDELYRLYGALADGVRVLILSDSCHSGTVAKMMFYQSVLPSNLAAVSDVTKLGAPPAKAIVYGPKFVPPDVALRTLQLNKEFYEKIGNPMPKVGPGGKDGETAKASIRLISGCQDNQVSFDGAVNSTFTAALLLVWDSGTFQGDYEDFHLKIQRMMLPTQSPNHYKVGKLDLAYDHQRPFTI